MESWYPENGEVEQVEDAFGTSSNTWSTLRIGEARIAVSSFGAVRFSPIGSNACVPFQMMEYGIPYTGTPLRIVRIEVFPNEFHNFFMHELVWQAFNGDVPHGWEVRHKLQALQDITPLTQEASNALDDIDIFPITVTRLTPTLMQNFAAYS